MPQRRTIRSIVAAAAIAMTATVGLSACADSGNGGGAGSEVVTWYINPDSGGNDPNKKGQAHLAKVCTDASNGAYTIRTQVSEGQTLMAGAKTAVTEYWSQRGAFPGSNASAGISAAASITGSYVTQVAVGSAGAITATYGKKANSKIANGTCSITPSDAGGSVTWRGTCSFAEKWRSAAFR